MPPPPFCCRPRPPTKQVPGCGADVATEERYCQKRRVCRRHMRAGAVAFDSDAQRQRFCSQCARFQPLAAFDGHHRCVCVCA
jgi:hypothetical protein